MREPNFIIGGAAAAGTSFLYELLIQHDEIYLQQNRIPEPHYYYKSWEYKKGLKWYLDTYFKDAKDSHIALGERSSSYLYGGFKVAKKIAKDFPFMKFIFMLRNPTQRAWANYRFTALQGLEDLSFYEALKKEKERIKNARGIWSEIQPYDYTGRGFYAKTLKEFLDYFPKEQILCIKSESISNEHLEQLPKIYKFLGLKDTSFIPQAAVSYPSFSIVSLQKQQELRKHFGDKFSEFINNVRQEKEVEIQDEEKYQALKQNLTYKKEKIPQECIKLLQEIFAKDLEELSKMVDFDINSWRGGGVI